MSEVANIPQLRFPEFSGEWEEKILGDISTNIMYGIGSAATKYDGVNKYLRITDINDSSRNFVPKPLTSPEGFINDSYKLSDGDIVFARTGASVGKSYLYKTSDGNLIFAGFLIKFNISSADPYFVYSNTFRSVYDNWVSVMSVRSGQPGINAEEYKLLPISLPTKPEQQKIAAFLTTVDNKIEQLSKKQELLGEYKKGLMQKIFSQAIRFKANDGSDFPDWEEKKISEVFKFKQGVQCGVENQHLEQQNNQVRFIRIIDLTSDNEPIRYIDDPGSEHHIFKDDLFMVRYGVAGLIGYGYKGIIANNLFRLLPFEPQIRCNKFYYFLLDYIKPKFEKLAASSTMPALNFKSINTVLLNNPCLEEQTKIANFLSSIDTKIEQVGKQLDESKQFKKALLQQMFV